MRIPRLALPLALALSASACSPAMPEPAREPAPASITPPAPAAEPPASPRDDRPAEGSFAPPPAEPEPPPFAAGAEAASGASPAGPAAPRDRTRATVLLYHMFGGIDSPLAIAPAAFEEQIRFLVDARVPVVKSAELLRFLDGEQGLPARVAVVTIDDGHRSVYTHAFPILKRYGVPFVIALNTAAIEGGRPEAVTWDEVREMMASGLCEIVSHSHIHGHMERLTDAKNLFEAETSREILEARTGVLPQAFVFPFGGSDARVRRTIEGAGYRAAFMAWGGAVRAGSPRFALPRIGVLRSTSIATFARLFAEG
jgi:peptidoglycan/xylan/chitin deacetylase (PgdA/CDA1 family)